MKTLSNFILTVLMSCILLCIACSENSTEPNEEEIPLDGSGGGVIAYFYQPLQSQDGLH
jgi:hypothetical protein